jgi:hypothetical protein
MYRKANYRRRRRSRKDSVGRAALGAARTAWGAGNFGYRTARRGYRLARFGYKLGRAILGGAIRRTRG